ncbi:hypothetical protein [Nitrospira sp. BLG_2]|uniref:hypothetical protein n=1 Tax=Nitrospira sp. BLG_2 TaxID=3397507 RepID=UPI003B99E49F
MSVLQTTRQIWAAPIVLGIVSAIGLVSALLGDGIWDALSWMAFTAPIAAILWAIARAISHSPSL